MISGTKLAIGSPSASVSIPTRSRPQPNWKHAVSTPNAAQTERKIANTAWAETRNERNAISSTRKPRALTAKMTRNSFEAISAARSRLPAVEPPTCAFISWPSVDWGMT